MDQAIASPVLQGDNEYLRRARNEALLEPIEIGSTLDMPKIAAREKLVREFAWAIPNDAALDAIAEHGPIVEIGAGGGYWAKLLRERGVDVLAYDNASWRTTLIWFTVDERNHTVITEHPDRSLFLCWPTMARWAAETLHRYEGDTVIYVGEWGGCTADEQFHDKLERDWEQVREVALPNFYGIHDFLSIWKRR